MPSAGFEPEIPVGDRPQTHALDRSATGISKSYWIRHKNDGTKKKVYFESYPLSYGEKLQSDICRCRLNFIQALPS